MPAAEEGAGQGLRADGVPPAEQAAGAHHEHQDQHAEGDEIAHPIAPPVDAESLGKSQHESADHRAGHGAQPTDGRRDESSKSSTRAAGGVDVGVEESDEDARDAGQRRGDDERQVLDPPHRDAHLARSIGILRGGADGLARLTHLEEDRQPSHRGQRDGEHHHIGGAEAHSPELQVVRRKNLGKGPRLRSEDQLGAVVEDHADRDRRQ